MTRKMYVGNINYATTEETLSNAFKEYGDVESVRIIKDQLSGRSKGFGFVEMTTDEDASKAMIELNGKEIDGRPIKVNEARERDDRHSHRRFRSHR